MTDPSAAPPPEQDPVPAARHPAAVPRDASLSAHWPLPPWVVRATAWNLAVIIAVAVLAGVIWLCVELRAAVVPLLLALLATSLLEPFTTRLTRGIRSRSAAAGIACAVLVAVVAGTVFLVVRAIADAAGGIGQALDRVGQRLGIGSTDDLVSSAARGLRSMGSDTASTLATGVLRGISTGAQVLTGSVLALALVYFTLRDGRRFPRLLDENLPAEPGRAAVRMAHRAWSALSGFMRGTTVIALAVVMMAVTAGTAVAGILGALLAVPLTAAVFGVLAEWRAMIAKSPEPAAEAGREGSGSSE